MLRANNDEEYFNTILGSYLLEKGILHHSSYNDTPQKNKMLKRKNKHLLEVARALMFTRNVPKIDFTNVVLTIIYLINRMSTKAIYMKSPIDVLKCHFPDVNVFGSLLLKIFGCVFFVHIHNRERSKLDPGALKYIFLGYSPTQKGYKGIYMEE